MGLDGEAAGPAGQDGQQKEHSQEGDRYEEEISGHSCLARKSGGAGDGDRTHITSLEGWGSTIELRPRVTFSYSQPSRLRTIDLLQWPCAPAVGYGSCLHYAGLLGSTPSRGAAQSHCNRSIAPVTAMLSLMFQAYQYGISWSSSPFSLLFPFILGHSFDVRQLASQQRRGVLQHRREYQGHDGHELQQDVQRRAGGVLEGVSDGVANNGGLVGL